MTFSKGERSLDELIDFSQLVNYYISYVTMAVVNNGGKCPVKIDDEELNSTKFKFFIPHVEIDKDSLRQAVERGEYLKIS